ncbi:MAG: hypothetical protein E7376_03065 [Clostridiales bacterium]|nr:hypothetical protein [Clostridiales bacterium]
MNIAIIGSGGDGAGMNECLYTLYSKLKKHNIMLFCHGLQGIINNEIVNYSINDLKQERTKGGIIIKSSRSSEFMTDKGFNKCISNLKKNKIDILIIMGGNGSYQATKKIIQAGIPCVFIPTTIDNDIKQSDYCIGFSTAVTNAIDFIQKVNTSMQAFDRTCIYEVMGRHCPDIANSVSKAVNACFCFVGTSKKTELLKAVKNELKTNTAPIIILQENTINIDELKQYLQNNIKNIDAKSAVVGYVQRGGFATKKELKMANGFATLASTLINKGEKNFMVAYDNSLNNFVSKNL